MAAFSRLTVLTIIAMASIVQLLAAPSAAFANEMKTARSVLRCRDAVMCGPNGLYIFLKLNNIAVTFQAIEKYIPSNEAGMSISELQRGCSDCGLATDIRRCSIDELCQNFSAPVLAYTTTPDSNIGHYLLILNIHGKCIDVMDPTTGETWMTSPQGLSVTWRGYVLTRTQSRSAIANWTIRSLLAWSVLFCGSVYSGPATGGVRVSQ